MGWTAWRILGAAEFIGPRSEGGVDDWELSSRDGDGDRDRDLDVFRGRGVEEMVDVVLEDLRLIFSRSSGRSRWKNSWANSHELPATGVSDVDGSDEVFEN